MNGLPNHRGIRTILLPGLDGTGELAVPFAECRPDWSDLHVERYPSDIPLSYSELVSRVAKQLDPQRPVLLIGESFGGPLSIRVAAEHPESVFAVVLVATFARFPVPGAAAYLPWTPLFSLPLPDRVARWFLLGKRPAPSLREHLQAAVKSVSPRVLAHRLRSVVRVDVRTLLRELQCPVLYLQAQHDHLVPSWCGRDIARTSAKVEVVQILTPHLLLQSAPEESWRQITDFVQR